MPFLLPIETYRAACNVGQFVYDEAPPAPPDVEAAKLAIFRLSRSKVRRSTRPSPALQFVALLTGVLVAVFGAIMGTAFGSVGVGCAVGAALGVAAVVVGLVGVRRTMQREIEAGAEEMTAQVWPQELQQLRSTYDAACHEYLSRQRVAFSAWKTEEAARIKWARRLVAGEPEVIEESVAESLHDVDFPFETSCAVSIEGQHVCYLHLDLPEVEDVIPEYRQNVLKNGRVQNVRREAAERFGEYSILATGLAILMARTALMAAPTLTRVYLAAYTQRKRVSSEAIGDAYVYIVDFSRDQIAAMDPDTVDPMQFVVSAHGQLNQRPTLEFAPLKPPEWVLNMRNATERAPRAE